VTDVARRFGVVRQTLHKWMVRDARRGLAGLAREASSFVKRMARQAGVPTGLAEIGQPRLDAMVGAPGSLLESVPALSDIRSTSGSPLLAAPFNGTLWRRVR
jgi:transposase-like protein